MSNEYVELARTDNQARGLGQYAVDFMRGKLGEPVDSVYQKVEQFHLDSIACGVSALVCPPPNPNRENREIGGRDSPTRIRAITTTKPAIIGHDSRLPVLVSFSSMSCSPLPGS